MKMTDRRLKQILRENPVQVEPKRREELLSRIGEFAEEEYAVTKRSARKILVIAALAVVLTMLISAAAVAYYYRTPDGTIVDKEGNAADTTENVTSGENDRGLSGTGYVIPAVTWTTANGQTTLAVWATRASEELTGLTAVIEGKPYPLTKATFNLNGNLVGYTAEGVPEPTVFTLTCERPAFTETVNFLPQDVIPAECTSNGLTLFGTAVGNTVYIGVNDANFLNMELAKTAKLTFVKPSGEEVTDSTGAVHADSRGGSSRDTELTTYARYDIAEGASIVSLKTPYLKIFYNFAESGALRDGTAPSVKVPVPADGETLEGEWVLLDSDGFRYVIRSIKREGDDLRFVAPEGLTYEGVYSIAADMPGTYLYTGISGGDMMSGGGSKYEWTMNFRDGELAEHTDENGEIHLGVFEMAIVYEGDWELHFE